MMFCSFSLARVFVILRELVNLLTSVCSRDSYVVLRLKVLLEQCIPLPAVVGCRKEKSLFNLYWLNVLIGQIECAYSY